jgi:hypothetical protein
MHIKFITNLFKFCSRKKNINLQKVKNKFKFILKGITIIIKSFTIFLIWFM